MSREVGIRELKNGISALIEGVENGEIVTITRRGKPVARIVPANVPPGIARLVAEGRVRLGSGPPGLPSPVKLRGPGKSAVDYVREGRR